jgi:hypothetical protein
MNCANIILLRSYLGGDRMKTYKLTAFEAHGEKIVDESFQAEHDDAAKESSRKTFIREEFTR